MSHDFTRAIQDAREMARTHHRWRSWLLRNPDDADQKVAGDIEHHREALKQYDNIIACLRRGLEMAGRDEMPNRETETTA